MLQNENIHLNHQSPSLSEWKPLQRPFRFDNLSELVHQLKQSSSLLHFQTSGSCGPPKCMTHRIDAFLPPARQATDDAVWGLCYHPCHMAGMQVLLRALFRTQSLVYLFNSKPTDVCRLLSLHKVDHLSATPTFYRMLLPLPHPLTTIRHLALGGEGVEESLVNRLRKAFPKAQIRNIYASTEAGILFWSDGTSFRIPPHLQAYIKVEEQQLFLHHSLLAHNLQQSEWHATGDRVEWVDDQHFRILGRVQDIVKVAGYRVALEEVSAAVAQLPGIRNHRVFARPNAISGHIICCDLVPTEAGCQIGPLKQQLKQQLLPYQRPRIIRLVDRIETGSSGKAKR
ncbi:MAG: AMP-binding protein [Bacteroidota bacterium]